MVSTTNRFVLRSRTPTPYVVAPLDALQLRVTVLLLSVGPGLVVVPGLGLPGIGGMDVELHGPSVLGVLLRLNCVLANLTVIEWVTPFFKLAGVGKLKA